MTNQRNQTNYIANDTVNKRKVREVDVSFITPTRGDTASLVLRLINQFSVSGLIFMVFIPK